jgi:hypothetical protein
MPVGPHGAHARLQHAPPHSGRPPSMNTVPPSPALPAQSCPSASPQFAAPAGGAAEQVPSAAPEAIVHEPAQQSAPVEQASPACPQKDDAWHVPAAHRFEQHCALAVHELPSVKHVALRAAHFPATQLWLQQSEPTVQGPVSEVHAG